MSIRFIIAVLSLSTFLVSGLSAEQYRLSGGETLELRAGAWDARNKTFANWDGVAGSYKMAPDGNIHVPIAGTVEVVGKTLDEVADTIASRMQRIVGLTELPAVSVEVSRYAPVFVGGAVTAPGQFDFIPGMTVEKALAIAGGYYRLPNEEGTQQTSLTRITGRSISFADPHPNCCSRRKGSSRKCSSIRRRHCQTPWSRNHPTLCSRRSFPPTSR